MMGVMEPGERIVQTNLIGTAAFAVSAVVAAAVFTNPVRIVAVVVALALFAIGIFGFIWSYITAVQRSRSDNIAVAQLYFLAGGSTPTRVKRLMTSAFFVQVVVALATAIARNRTDGRAGSTLAFGILVPMFGLGMNGLWCSKHGSFSARQASAVPPHEEPVDGRVDELGRAPAEGTDMDTNVVGVPPSDDEMEQNSRHG
ncbi:MAG: hypothetical protein JWN62_3314 [Acidimicrobiales bacterium]|nr:hypothetical protein [Acidimicrobiales bacterium]